LFIFETEFFVSQIETHAAILASITVKTEVHVRGTVALLCEITVVASFAIDAFITKFALLWTVKTIRAKFIEIHRVTIQKILIMTGIKKQIAVFCVPRVICEI